MIGEGDEVGMGSSACIFPLFPTRYNLFSKGVFKVLQSHHIV